MPVGTAIASWFLAQHHRSHVMASDPCPTSDPCHEAKIVQSPEELSSTVYGEPHHLGAGFAGSPDPDPNGDWIDAIEAEEARQCSKGADFDDGK
jgi:hypothetical protein